jgi:hypothetical protein
MSGSLTSIRYPDLNNLRKKDLAVTYPLAILYIMDLDPKKDYSIKDIAGVVTKTIGFNDENLFTSALIYLTENGFIEKTSDDPLRLKISDKGAILINIFRKLTKDVSKVSVY